MDVLIKSVSYAQIQYLIKDMDVTFVNFHYALNAINLEYQLKQKNVIHVKLNSIGKGLQCQNVKNVTKQKNVFGFANFV